MLIPAAVAGSLTLSALSVQVPVADRFVPSLIGVTGLSQCAMPDKPSAPVKVTVTSLLFHPNGFGPGDAAAVAVGFALSMLMPLTVAGSALLPAMSTQLPVFVTERLCPSAVTVDPSTVFVPTADCTGPVSAHAKLTATSVLFQP